MFNFWETCSTDCASLTSPALLLSSVFPKSPSNLISPQFDESQSSPRCPGVSFEGRAPCKSRIPPCWPPGCTFCCPLKPPDSLYFPLWLCAAINWNQHNHLVKGSGKISLTDTFHSKRVSRLGWTFICPGLNCNCGAVWPLHKFAHKNALPKMHDWRTVFGEINNQHQRKVESAFWSKRDIFRQFFSLWY